MAIGDGGDTLPVATCLSTSLCVVSDQLGDLFTGTPRHG